MSIELKSSKGPAREIRKHGDYMRQYPAATGDDYTALEKAGGITVSLDTKHSVRVIVTGLQVWCLDHRGHHCSGQTFNKCAQCPASVIRTEASRIASERLRVAMGASA